jgi:hypothetical protein
MMNKLEVQCLESGNPQGDTSASKPVGRHRFLKQVTSPYSRLRLQRNYYLTTTPRRLTNTPLRCSHGSLKAHRPDFRPQGSGRI